MIQKSKNIKYVYAFRKWRKKRNPKSLHTMFLSRDIRTEQLGFQNVMGRYYVDSRRREFHRDLGATAEMMG